MKQILTAVALAGTCFGASVAQPKPEPVKEVPARADTKSRTVQVSEKTVITIRAAVLESTLLTLPEGEKVGFTFSGDTKNWLLQSAKVPTRYLSVKPMVAHTQTNLHIITDHGNDYSFLLTEVSGQAEPYDVKVFIEAADKKIQENIQAAPVMISVEESERVKREAEAAKQAAEATVKATQAKFESESASFREKYPSTLNFGWSWNKAKGDKIGLDQIWNDDRFTYFKAHPVEAPALYEVKEGKPSLINFELRDGVYIVTKLIESGYLAVGKLQVDFRKVTR